jgi:hypothetical protein
VEVSAGVFKRASRSRKRLRAWVGPPPLRRASMKQPRLFATQRSTPTYTRRLALSRIWHPSNFGIE